MIIKIYIISCQSRKIQRLQRCVSSQKIKLWKERGDEICKQENKKGSRYHGMITVWTVGDPLKRQTAKDNNLNYLEFFSVDELKIWLDHYGEDEYVCG